MACLRSSLLARQRMAFHTLLWLPAFYRNMILEFLSPDHQLPHAEHTYSITKLKLKLNSIV
jgi:hypothetical protein